MPNLADLQPYVSLINTILSVATLTFLINIMRLMHEAAKAKAEVLEERLKGAKDDIERTEKWATRDKEALTEEVNRLNEKLTISLADAGINAEALELGVTTQILRQEIRPIIEQTANKMERAIAELKEGQLNEQRSIDPEWYLELGRGFMATQEWSKAADELDKYVALRPLDWKAQLSRGVSHSNSRRGKDSDISAIRAYNEALTLGAEYQDANLQARILSHRGGMNKRIGRLDEAEADLNRALRIATAPYEIGDAKYGLACVYAMRGERSRLMEIMNSLKGESDSPRAFRFIRSHLDDYFSKFKDDLEFLNLLNQT